MVVRGEVERTDGVRAFRGLAVGSRFGDVDRERAFQQQYFRDNVRYVRIAHVLAIATWAFFLVFAVPAHASATHHVILTIGIVLTSASLALTFVDGYASWWQRPIVVLVVVGTAISEMHRMLTGHPARWEGVVSLLLILMFAYALLRLQTPYAAVAGVLAVVCYNLTRVLVQTPGDIGLVDPDLYLAAFVVIGTVTASMLEGSARALFLRERELDHERERGDRLLRNILPEPIIDRLKTRQSDGGNARVAERYADATVLFVDLVGFTEQAASMEPDELVVTLDTVFGRLDALVDDFGLEKIKTIGDAYMAVAGVPEPRPDHVDTAAAMALHVLDAVAPLQWPSGVAIRVRVGLACGPVVAGVIGDRKFAYDIWGDTVNAASRLESAAVPGTILVSDQVRARLDGKYSFSEPHLLDLKGKGPTTAHTLLDRAAAGDRYHAPQMASLDSERREAPSEGRG